MTDERFQRTFIRILDGLKVPLVGIRAAVQRIEWEIRARDLRTSDVFRRDYLGDVWAWTELMRRLIIEPPFVGVGNEPIESKATPVFLLKDVIAGAVRQVESLLRERRFSPEKIRWTGFEEIPQLWIDQNQLQQVFFNLLSNSIKYAWRDPAAFQVEIIGTYQGDCYLIRFRDWGIGVPQGLEEAVFEDGYRGSNACDYSRAGQGLGLWVARRIVEGHAGQIRLTAHRLPTEFTITLPAALNRAPPVFNEMENEV